MQPCEKEGNRTEELYQSSLGFGVAEESGKLIIREVKPDTPAELADCKLTTLSIPLTKIPSTRWCN